MFMAMLLNRRIHNNAKYINFTDLMHYFLFHLNTETKIFENMNVPLPLNKMKVRSSSSVHTYVCEL